MRPVTHLLLVRQTHRSTGLTTGTDKLGHVLDSETAEAVRRFGMFREMQTRDSSPLYTALSDVVLDDLRGGGPTAALLECAPLRQRIPNLLFAAVQFVLFETPNDPLAQYYPSLSGTCPADDALATVFTDFVAARQADLAPLLATGETQTNEVLRATSLYPAFGWAQSRTPGPLALIEVGTSAGLLLHADRYAYHYEFDDGSERVAGRGVATGVPVLRCRVHGETFDATEPRIAARIGLDINPLDPADPHARRWLDALVWPEHAERRVRLRAALDHAATAPVDLRRGDALDTLPDAVAAVGDATPCVFVSNSLPHWTKPARAQFAAVIRELGGRRDLLCIVKEAHPFGLGLFTGRKADPADTPITHETLGVAEFRDGVERLFRLGTAGLHGVGLHWSPRPA